MILEMLTLLAAWLLWWSFKTYRNLKGMPPGPIPLPVIGNYLHMRFGMKLSHEKLHHQYGDIYTLTFPQIQMVVLNSGELVREALITKGDDTAARPQSMFYPVDDVYQGAGLLPTDFGHKYRLRRRIYSTAMHLFGNTGIAETQKGAYSAVDDFLNSIEAQHGKSFIPMPYIRRSIIIGIWQWLSPSEGKVPEEIIEGMDQFQQKFMEVAALGKIANFVPFYAHLSSNLKACLKDAKLQRDSIIQKEIDRHLELYDSNNARGIIDNLIKAYKKNLSSEETKHQLGENDVNEIRGLVIDSFIPATDTSMAIISWFFLYMILYPEVQQKIQAQLDEVIGRDEFPKWRDATKLPYLQATIYEVIRHSSAVPMIARNASSDIILAGYKVPKGTFIFCNKYMVNKSSAQWTQPETFEPERFIDAEGQLKIYTSFLPFGGGTRKCPGEVVGKIQVFTFAACLLQHFEFSTVRNQPKPSLQIQDEYMAVYYPRKYAMVAVERK